MKDIQKPVWFEMEYFTSLFQALRQWGRRKSERHAKSWRGGKKEKGKDSRPPPLPSFLPFLFLCSSRFLNSADPTISEPGAGQYFTNYSFDFATV